MIEVRKKDRESASALLFRFTKRIKRSGVLREAKQRRFHDRPVSKRDRRISALHREVKKREHLRLKKLGVL